MTVRTLTAAPYARLVLDRLTRLACRAVGAERACVFVRDRVDPRVTIAVAAHGHDEDLIGRRFGADEGVVGRALRTASPVAFDHRDELPLALEDDGVEWNLCAGACAPIEWDGVVQGAIVTVSTRGRQRFDRQSFGVLGAVADVAGAALEHAERREHNEETVRARVETLTAALELRDNVTGRHVSEVVDLAVEVGEALGLEAAAMVELEFAARLHDVGKIAVPDLVLKKPGPLSAAEWSMMRRHPEWGSGMLAHIPGLEAVAIVVRFHHERYDGAGYPDGLAADCIPLASRIVAVCDAYNAMTAHRPYREGRAHDDALAELRREAGGQFDPRVVEAFCASAGRSRR